MALRQIVKEGDRVLRKQCRPVTSFDQKLWTLLDDMNETLDQAQGLGLAAPQVGILRRVVVIHMNDEVLEMVNPEIIERRGEQECMEGCLSIPGEWGILNRPEFVKVRYYDRHGDCYEVEGDGLFASCASHETDHLDGILYTDKVIRMVDPSELEEAQQPEE
ncbi:MAG: peptide deformylase [Clostridia bacterium]|jgi:peptide deformylase|nr:peptide deformylase [Clostridia bacterium]MBQ1554345.1 peptide deformylase [Clostridia bacterium]MBQ4396573.1 peptide deformylase [Clostridia bacterium]